MFIVTFPYYYPNSILNERVIILFLCNDVCSTSTSTSTSHGVLLLRIAGSKSLIGCGDALLNQLLNIDQAAVNSAKYHGSYPNLHVSFRV